MMRNVNATHFGLSAKFDEAECVFGTKVMIIPKNPMLIFGPFHRALLLMQDFGIFMTVQRILTLDPCILGFWFYPKR